MLDVPDHAESVRVLVASGESGVDSPAVEALQLMVFSLGEEGVMLRC